MKKTPSKLAHCTVIILCVYVLFLISLTVKAGDPGYNVLGITSSISDPVLTGTYPGGISLKDGLVQPGEPYVILVGTDAGLWTQTLAGVVNGVPGSTGTYPVYPAGSTAPVTQWVWTNQNMTLTGTTGVDHELITATNSAIGQQNITRLTIVHLTSDGVTHCYRADGKDPYVEIAINYLNETTAINTGAWSQPNSDSSAVQVIASTLPDG